MPKSEKPRSDQIEPKCKTCGDTGWVAFDFKSDQIHSMLITMGVDFEFTCMNCDLGRAELEATKATRASRRE